MEDNSKNKTVTSKALEKRSLIQNSEPPVKRTNTQESLRSHISQIVPSQFSANSSPVKKILLEANKIIKIGMAKEVALYEKDTTIQNSNETIDNLRRNLIQLQMEYEKLDQNYQNEVSCRSEILKRMDTTRNIVESTVKFSNVLSQSLKQLEEDKFRLAEYYELILRNQKDVEDKHKIVAKRITEMNECLNSKFDEVKKVYDQQTFEDAQILSEHGRKLTEADNKFMIILQEKESLIKKVEDFKSAIENLNESLKNKEEIMSLQQRNIKKIRMSLKSNKIKNESRKKFWKRKKKEQIVLKKKLKETIMKLQTVEASMFEYVTSNHTLEGEKVELKEQLEEQMSSFQAEKREWSSTKEKLLQVLGLKEKMADELILNNTALTEKISEFERKTKEMIRQDEENKFNCDQLQNNYVKIVDENTQLKKCNDELIEENNKKIQLIQEFESKLNLYDNDFKSKKTLFKTELQKYEDIIKNLESKIGDLEEKLRSERAKNEKCLAECKKQQEDSQSANEKINQLEKLLQEKADITKKLHEENENNVTKLQSLKTQIDEIRRTELRTETKANNLNKDYQKMIEKNDELRETIRQEQENVESLKKELEKAKKKISDMDERLADEHNLKTNLKTEKAQLEKDMETLKKDVKEKEKHMEELARSQTIQKEKLDNLNKTSEENSSLKSTILKLKARLEENDARVEAFKVIIKKLESEKIEAKENRDQEISRMKAELVMLQESVRKERDPLNSPRCEPGQSDKDTDLPGIRKLWNKVRENASFHAYDSKENEPVGVDSAKSQQGSTTPLQSNRKFLSTPRKILTSTPQSRIQNSTPIKKKRDPYEFDSDESVERLDADQVLKALGPRSKKESAAKRPKT